ncbi:M15 family metallopeptidase [Pontibacter sp. G13]|uniref:M15 family metallopeptidase n=1 Tax=Pontibacter sp. G13 TaxID=3074898 RepID=UPI00288AF7E2|nr:M15 family metallopeptidase [Pontibacter sp. G13]WNJ18530.1 M15 family metallopeptidase [Pontibacter sp. G13]
MYKCFFSGMMALFVVGCASNAHNSTAEAPAESDSLTQITDTIPMEEPLDTVAVEYLLGKFDPAKAEDFVRIEDAYSGGNARGTYLHQEAYEAFKKMHAAAKADGVTLTILSSTRNFWRQKSIWEAKWTGSRLVGGKNLAKTVANPQDRALVILKYSSMPGTSRHHWGTDIDINNFENSYFESGRGLKEYQWLVAHGPEFGFCQPYSAKGTARPFGYEMEKWHWSYMPLAKRYLNSYQALVNHDMIEGFKGSEAASGIDVITKYVMGISPDCK